MIVRNIKLTYTPLNERIDVAVRTLRDDDTIVTYEVELGAPEYKELKTMLAVLIADVTDEG